MPRPPALDRPDLSIEQALSAELDVTLVAGVDEAGRGALAGPVVAAAILLPSHPTQFPHDLSRVRDSKRLSPNCREQLFPVICECAIGYGIGFTSAEWVDQFGILAATRRAMDEALCRLGPAVQAVLVDGPLRLVSGNIPQRPVVRGDQRSLSIAAASVLAKVSRDRYMVDLAERYPHYGFERHKGYGTAEHLAALGRLGPCPEHRRSFSPVRAGLF